MGSAPDDTTELRKDDSRVQVRVTETMLAELRCGISLQRDSDESQ